MDVIFTPIPLEGAYVIEPERKSDSRGFFARTWCAEEFAAHGLAASLSQCNISHSIMKGTLRGMHFQRAPHQENKIVGCLKGAIYDVIIDLRRSSKTYRQWFGIELSADDHKMIYVPHGFAHGMQTLEDETRIGYYVSSPYVPDAEAGVRFDDPAFGIAWPLPVSVISSKDRLWPSFTHDHPRHDTAAV